MRTLLLLLIFAGPATAQTHYGARANTVAVWQEINADDVYLGIGVSAFGERMLTRVLAIGVDVGYSQSGFDDTTVTRQDGPEPGDRNFVTIGRSARAHLVTLAPALTIQIPGEFVRPYVFAGPRLDLVVAERFSLDGESGSYAAYSGVGAGASAGFGAGVAAPGSGPELRLDVRGSRLEVREDRREWAVEVRAGLRL